MTSTPAIALLMSAFIAISVASDAELPHIVTNRYDSCLSIAGQASCWGKNARGQLGRCNTINIGADALDLELALSPIDLGENFTVAQIAGGGEGHHCAKSVDWRLKCWGLNHVGTYCVHAD